MDDFVDLTQDPAAPDNETSATTKKRKVTAGSKKAKEPKEPKQKKPKKKTEQELLADLSVEMDQRLFSVAPFDVIPAQLIEKGIRVCKKATPVGGMIRFRRARAVDDAPSSFPDSPFKTAAPAVVEEDVFLVVFLTGEQFVAHIQDKAMEELVVQAKSLVDPSCRVLFLLQGVYEFAESLRWKVHRHPSASLPQTAATAAGAPEFSYAQLETFNAGKRRKSMTRLDVVVSKEEVEEWLVWLQVETQVENHLCSSVHEVPEYLYDLTKALAEAPYKKATSYYGRKGSAHTASAFLDNDSQQSHRLTWIDQLMQIPGISEDKAKAVVDRYPSFRSLLEQYLRADCPLKDKEALLKDIAVTNLQSNAARRLGPVLSKRLFALFTSMDGEAPIL